MSKRPQLTGRAAVLALVVCAIAMSLAYPVREYIAQRRQIAELQQQRNDALSELNTHERRNLQLQDPSYLKREARRRLHYCGPAPEKCYVVRDDGARPGPAGAGQVREIEKAPWYQTLWESIEAADKGTGRKAQTGESEGGSG
ncbi:FtsB family cell division protein [Sinosporangium siamense]|uniref:Septum formation initiator n=1 Tax=Sinosporangium siamense TaxID=1367973 RepID=A0A919RJV6_9ACTN|nr:septum formation initiator family protein [Sinosporangium siamense]GII93249.1 septum formation initiator [Sinosporangium siamense]